MMVNQRVGFSSSLKRAMYCGQGMLIGKNELKMPPAAIADIL
jgi:hypothetical protein